MQAWSLKVMVTNPRAKSVLIGTLAERTGVNIETIRYYERVALLPSPRRSDGGHRIYEQEHIQRLNFVRRSRELGFPLDDIRALLTLVDTGNSDCSAAREIALRHLAEVHGKIRSLKRLERALKTMTNACQPGKQSSCPIIEALSARIDGATK
jgi:MerR family transcriptional regulator, mercuric resistance operon regulatory protein